MRKLLICIACGLILAGIFALIICGGMLDTPGYPIEPAAVVGLIAIVLMGSGTLLANLYEGGRI